MITNRHPQKNNLNRLLQLSPLLDLEEQYETQDEQKDSKKIKALFLTAKNAIHTIYQALLLENNEEISPDYLRPFFTLTMEVSLLFNNPSYSKLEDLYALMSNCFLTHPEMISKDLSLAQAFSAIYMILGKKNRTAYSSLIKNQEVIKHIEVLAASANPAICYVLAKIYFDRINELQGENKESALLKALSCLRSAIKSNYAPAKNLLREIVPHAISNKWTPTLIQSKTFRAHLTLLEQAQLLMACKNQPGFFDWVKENFVTNLQIILKDRDAASLLRFTQYASLIQGAHKPAAALRASQAGKFAPKSKPSGENSPLKSTFSLKPPQF